MASSADSPATSVGRRASGLFAAVDELGPSVIGPAAVQVDEQARHPEESWAALRPHGALAMRIPLAYGGLDLDQENYCRVLERIARWCAPTAMTIHMHSLVCEFVKVLGTPEQQERYFDTVVDGPGIFGSWGSEPGTSPNQAYLMETTLRPKDEAFILNGVKHFCTMAGAATTGMVFCVLDDAGDGQVPDQLANARLVLIRADEPGLSVIGTWNPLGMRGSVSPGTRYDDIVVPRDAVLGNPLAAGVLEQFGFGHAAVLIGVAGGALDAAVDFVRTKKFANTEPLAADAAVQRHVGAIAGRLDGAWSMTLEAARRSDGLDNKQKGIEATRTKYLTQETALHATNACLELVGARSVGRGHRIERAYRDVRTASLMPPNNDRAEQILGIARLDASG